MTMLIRSLLSSLLVFFLAQNATLATELALPTVSHIDLQRYSGRWYEISRLPMWFERNCTGDITATYTLREDQRINVVNRCNTKDGFISANGIAEMPDSKQPGQLRVRFAPAWLAWLPAVWGDYWIIDLDTQYRWVMVGAPNRDYLWILSRTPALDAHTVDGLKQKATTLGFKVDEMVNVTNAPQ